MDSHNSLQLATLTSRQLREIEYHRRRAQKITVRPPSLDSVQATERRPWNSYWSMFDQIRGEDLRGRRVLVPGCGFGGDVIRLSALGARVYGSDISPESIELAKHNVAQVDLDHRPELAVMPCETMDYPDAFFDGVVLINILHHVDISRTVAELTRVCKPGAMVVVREQYTSRQLQRIRESWLIDKVIHAALQNWFYGGKTYITEDERKLDQQDVKFLQEQFPRLKIRYFDIVHNRLFPKSVLLAKTDNAICKRLPQGWQGFLGSVLTGFCPLECDL